MPNALILVDQIETNAVGRAYSLLLCLKHLGWTSHVLGHGNDVWFPLTDETSLRDAVRYLPHSPDRILEPTLARTDLIVAVKAHPGSFGVGLGWSRRFGLPILLDMDDFELPWSQLPRRVKLGIADPRSLRMGEHPFQRRRLEKEISGVPVSVASPPLVTLAPQASIVPHARALRSAGLPHRSTRPVVAFVGTVRKHKGVERLRSALARLATGRFTLVITADTPPDGRPWERWVGALRLKEGLDLLDRSDIVALLQDTSPFAEHQFPVKAIDAMLSGRAIVASDTPVLRWALEDAAIFVAHGDDQALRDALTELQSPGLRAELGSRAREVAVRRFSVEAVSPMLRHALTMTRSSGPYRAVSE